MFGCPSAAVAGLQCAFVTLEHIMHQVHQATGLCSSIGQDLKPSALLTRHACADGEAAHHLGVQDPVPGCAVPAQPQKGGRQSTLLQPSPACLADSCKRAMRSIENQQPVRHVLRFCYRSSFWTPTRSSAPTSSSWPTWTCRSAEAAAPTFARMGGRQRAAAPCTLFLQCPPRRLAACCNSAAVDR